MPYQLGSPTDAAFGAMGGYLQGAQQKKERQAAQQRQAQQDAQRAQTLAAQQALAQAQLQGQADDRTYRRTRDTKADELADATRKQAGIDTAIKRRSEGYDETGAPIPDTYTGKPQGQNLDPFFGINAAPTYGDQATDMLAHAAALRKNGENVPAAAMEAAAQKFMELQRSKDAEEDRRATQAATERYRTASLAGQNAGRANTERHERVMEGIGRDRANRPTRPGTPRNAEGLTPGEQLSERHWQADHNPDGTPKRAATDPVSARRGADFAQANKIWAATPPEKKNAVRTTLATRWAATYGGTVDDAAKLFP